MPAPSTTEARARGSSLRALWGRFFCLTSSGRGEALFRVGYCLLLGIELIGLSGELDLYFVSGGAHPRTALEGLYGRSLVHLLHGLWCIVGSLLLVGVWPRAIAALNLLLAIYFFGLRGAAAPHGADWMIHSMAFCLVLMQSDRWLSLRNPWRMPSEADAVPGWPLRVAQLYYAALYFTAGVAKLPDPAWLNGTAFANVLQNPLLTRFDFTWTAQYPALMRSIGHFIVAWELALPFFLVPRRTRLWAVGSALVFHVGLDWVLRVGWFGWFSIVHAAVFFDDFMARIRPGTTPRTALAPSRRAQLFLVFHCVAFAAAQTAYLVAPFAGTNPFRMPWLAIPGLTEYVAYVARIHFFNVWPNSYFLEPVRLVTYEARDEQNRVTPIAPFDERGAFRPGLSMSREAREGLLALKIVAFGMPESAWKRYAEHLAARYASQYEGGCPRQIRFYRILEPLSAFGAEPKALRVPKLPLVTAEFSCPERRLVGVRFP